MIGRTMRAAQYNSETNKIEVNEVAIPTCSDNDLLIKNKCATLCHSDLMLFWGHTAEKPPMPKVTIGHENSGVVVSFGKNVKGFKIGDNVGCLGCSYACYECTGCQVHNLLCEKGSGRLHGFTTDGHFAEYSITDYRNAMVLPEGMDVTTAAPLFCAGITAYHAVNDCELVAGNWVAVVGCGGLGHLGIQYAKAMGLKVIGIDVSESQLESAISSGADHVYNSSTSPDYVEELKQASGGGVHATIVFSAAKAAYDGAPKVLRTSGIMMVVGIPKEELSFNALDILLGKYRIKGASSGVPQRMRPAIEFSHQYNIRPHLTTFDDLDNIYKIIDLMNAGKTAGRFGIVF